MKVVSNARMNEAQENNEGYCRVCEAFTCEDIEPDSDGNECPECDQPQVMGVDRAVMHEEVGVSEDASVEDSDVAFFSLSDDEG